MKPGSPCRSLSHLFSLRRAPSAFARALALLAMLVANTSGALTLHDTGRWTPASASWGGTAVHMALLPGYGSSYHSKILWWYGLGDDYAQVGPYGGLWGWNASDYDGSSFPSLSFTELNPGFPSEGKIFCAGFTQMDDGKLLIAGGTQSGTENGMKHAFFYDGVGNSWTQVDSMANPRWYPTATEMADGKVLLTSGSVDLDIHYFSGLIGSESAPSDSSILRFGDRGNGEWHSAVGPSSQQEWPSPRVGAAGMWGYVSTTAMHVFGGKNAGGGYLNDLWLLRRGENPLGSDYSYVWDPKDRDDATHTYIRPSRRANAVMAVDDASQSMIIFGGIGKDNEGSEAVLGDVWRAAHNDEQQWPWTQPTITGDSPGPRYGERRPDRGRRARLGARERGRQRRGARTHRDTGVHR